MRPIDADALYKALEETQIRVPFDKVKMFDLIENAPTLDGETVREGEWLFGERDILGAEVKCSNCGWKVERVDPSLWLAYPGHKFCGSCGAKMDGGDGDGWYGRKS